MLEEVEIPDALYEWESKEREIIYKQEGEEGEKIAIRSANHNLQWVDVDYHQNRMEAMV